MWSTIFLLSMTRSVDSVDIDTRGPRMVCKSPHSFCQRLEALTALTLTQGYLVWHVKLHIPSDNAQKRWQRWQWTRDASHTTQALLLSMSTLSTLLSVDSGPEMLHIPPRLIYCHCQRSWALTVSQECFTYHSDPSNVNVNAVNDSGRWQYTRDASHVTQIL